MNKMSKSHEMEKFLENTAQQFFGRSRQGDACVTCGSTNVSCGSFRDALSIREFRISHMCQKCQDSVFNIPDDAYDYDDSESMDP